MCSSPSDAHTDFTVYYNLPFYFIFCYKSFFYINESLILYKIFDVTHFYFVSFFIVFMYVYTCIIIPISKKVASVMYVS